MSRTPTLAEVIDEAMRAGLAEVRVAIPARVEAYDASAQTVDVKPMIKEVLVDADGNSVTESLPVLPAIPVCFPRGGGFFVARRELALDRYPAVAQRKMDAAAAAWAKRKDNAVADAKALAVVNSVDRQAAEAENTDIPLWGAVAVALGGIAVGASVVAVFGW